MCKIVVFLAHSIHKINKVMIRDIKISRNVFYRLTKMILFEKEDFKSI